MIEIKPLNTLAQYLQRLQESRLWVKVLVAMFAGLACGFLLSPDSGIFNEGTSTTIGNWLALPGKLFLKLVQMIMIPLIFTSIISGIVSNSKARIRQLGLRLLLYFLATTIVSILLGVLLAMLFQPGKYIRLHGQFTLHKGADELPSRSEPFTDIPNAISELLPENPLASMVTGEMLSIVIFTVIIGIAITQLKVASIRPLMNLFRSIQEICMTVVSWAMHLVPYAVFGLIAQLTASIGFESLTGIGYYSLIVLLGLLLLLVFYLLLIVTSSDQNPWSFMKDIRDVQLLAFSTTSSAAVMPLSMKTADEKLGVSPNISDFIIPVGATINMDGTALYQCISTLFIAQVYGIEMTVANVILIMITIVAASIGTPAIPGGGVIILASVLKSAGIPAEGIIIIIGVERILGMFRVAVNVTGDLTACVLFNRWFGDPANQKHEDH